ncbi:hypothetical protein MXMO3_01763 [Maritalea myrionectae]|uniref:HNH nuclease domain-containing protein n=1 Tax=Maritalea myrionectae TaxID=454601 RepID=A0A2R4ME22_9HYPH|nr:HNH endonuclease [Maritalea myrionectae]AVX04288.1 hypothetical protein MXMO3_01763 [Maritalea myrionectae]
MTKIKNPIGRATEEWIGSSPDAKVPDRVRLRVFERHNGICYLSGIKILPGMDWDIEHVVPLCMGGEHRESNMRPALRKYHKPKTAKDRKAKAKSDRIRKKHLGIRKPSRMPGSRNSKFKRKLDGTVVER